MNAQYLLYKALRAESEINRERREAHYRARLDAKLSKEPRRKASKRTGLSRRAQLAFRTKRLRGLVAWRPGS